MKKLTLGQLLKEELLTQKDLAEMMELSGKSGKSQVSRWVNGHVPPSIKSLQKLRKLFPDVEIVREVVECT